MKLRRFLDNSESTSGAGTFLSIMRLDTLPSRNVWLPAKLLHRFTTALNTHTDTRGGTHRMLPHISELWKGNTYVVIYCVYRDSLLSAHRQQQ